MGGAVVLERGAPHWKVHPARRYTLQLLLLDSHGYDQRDDKFRVQVPPPCVRATESYHRAPPSQQSPEDIKPHPQASDEDLHLDKAPTECTFFDCWLVTTSLLTRGI